VPTNHFFSGTDMTRLCAYQSMFISPLVGGREEYTGRDINAVHAPLRSRGLDDTHFDAFLKHFRAALQEVGVADDKAEKTMKLLEGKRREVLNR
jgi:hemoglobin